MKKILAALAIMFTLSCSNGGGEKCECEDEGTNIGLATQTVQGDVPYCDERRATGQCKHTRACDAKAKSVDADGFDWNAPKDKK